MLSRKVEPISFRNGDSVDIAGETIAAVGWIPW